MKNRIDLQGMYPDPFAMMAALRSRGDGAGAPPRASIAPGGPGGPWTRCVCLSDPGPDPFPDPDPSNIFD